MLYVPVTLPASKMFGTMTTLLNEIRNKESLAPSEIINKMVDSARIGKVDFGKGIIYNFKLAPQPVIVAFLSKLLLLLLEVLLSFS